MIAIVSVKKVITETNVPYRNLKLDLYVSCPHNSTIPKRNRRVKMSIAKNMEFIFIGALLVAAGTSFAVAAPAPAKPAIATASVKAKIPTVYVVAKRLTAEQKAKLNT
jgi:hypothetical protein